MSDFALLEIQRLGIKIRAPKLMDPQPWASFDGYAEWRKRAERRSRETYVVNYLGWR